MNGAGTETEIRAGSVFDAMTNTAGKVDRMKVFG
jgi:hypothetical protein